MTPILAVLLKVEIADLKRANTIFGPHLPELRGWSVRKSPKQVKVEAVEIPKEFYRLTDS